MKKVPVVENDNVLVHVEDKPAFFARVEEIAPDIKKGWWRVKLLILQVPVFFTSWILDNDQIRGADFTMNGTPIRIEKVVAPTTLQPIQSVNEKENQQPKNPGQKKARIISINQKSDSKQN